MEPGIQDPAADIGEQMKDALRWTTWHWVLGRRHRASTHDRGHRRMIEVIVTMQGSTKNMVSCYSFAVACRMGRTLRRRWNANGLSGPVEFEATYWPFVGRKYSGSALALFLWFLWLRPKYTRTHVVQRRRHCKYSEYLLNVSIVQKGKLCLPGSKCNGCLTDIGLDRGIGN